MTNALADIEVWKAQMLNLQTTWNFIHVAVDLENCVDSNSNRVVDWKSERHRVFYIVVVDMLLRV